MLKVSNLHFSHRARGRTQPIFSGLSFELPYGENLSVVGPSGCGKSTLLFLLAGLLPTDEGEIFFEGGKIESPSRERMIVFQDHALLPWLTCLKNVIFSLETHPHPPADREAAAMDFLKKVGLENFAGHYPGELSGGMRQRLGIARALATDPKLLLLDEPFSSLDAITRNRIFSEMTELLQREKKAAVLVTHDVSEALRFAHNTLILGGREPLFLKSNAIEKEEVYAAWMDRA